MCSDSGLQWQTNDVAELGRTEASLQRLALASPFGLGGRGAIPRTRETEARLGKDLQRSEWAESPRQPRTKWIQNHTSVSAGCYSPKSELDRLHCGPSISSQQGHTTADTLRDGVAEVSNTHSFASHARVESNRPVLRVCHRKSERHSIRENRSCCEATVGHR
jgi:hypothetical protein